MLRSILVASLLAGCAATTPATTPVAVEHRVEKPPPAPGLTRISGRATREFHYCAGGGARVTEEMSQAARRTEPLSVEFVVAEGNEIGAGAEVTRFHPDGHGDFEVELRDGSYCVYRAGRELTPRATATAPATDGPPTPAPPPFFSAECLEQERKRCDATWTVSGGPPAEPELALWERCSQPFNQPCYQGPMPP